MPASKVRPITAQDLYDLQLIADVRLSPDGGHVVYSQQRVDREKEKRYTSLWVAPTDGSEPPR
jgi:dipeptidyl aminopeptidase/acylaminoacyl peptidase